MNRTTLTVGSLLVCLLMTLSTLGGITVQNQDQPSLELTETETMQTANSDLDSDGILNSQDACPNTYGTSTKDRIGCIDTDGDGWSDLGDDFHNQATQWKDTDGDSLGDNYADESLCRPSHWPGEFVENAILTDDSPIDFDNDGFEDEGLASFHQYIIGSSVSQVDIAVNSSAVICSSTQINGIDKANNRYLSSGGNKVFYDNSGSLHIISTYDDNAVNVNPSEERLEFHTNHSIWDGVSWTVNTLQDENGSNLYLLDMVYVNNTLHAIVRILEDSAQTMMDLTTKYALFTEAGNWHFQNLSSYGVFGHLAEYEFVASEVGFSDDVYLVTSSLGYMPMYSQVYSNVTYANSGTSESIELNAHLRGSIDDINGFNASIHSTHMLMDTEMMTYQSNPLDFMDLYIDSSGDLAIFQDYSLFLKYNVRGAPNLDWNCGNYVGGEYLEPIAHLDQFDKMHLFSMDVFEGGQLFFGVSNSSYSNISGAARCIDMEPFDSPDEFGFNSGNDLVDYRLGGIHEEAKEGTNFKMEVDSNGYTHVVYTNCFYDAFSPMEHRIKYAFYDGLEWDISIIVPYDVDCSKILDFALSNDDKAYIGYTNANGERMNIFKESDESISSDVNFDSCENTFGDSWRDRYGCLDQDFDGQSDLNDDFWQEGTQWMDSDGDQLGDNWADESLNSTRSTDWPGEWVENAWLPDPSPLDWDQDGFEDDWLDGSIGPIDDCPYVYGYSTIDLVGCPDADQDGYSDSADLFPGDSNEWEDTDSDGVGDNSDEFPEDSTESEDSDGDGVGDNADQFPYDSDENVDSDNDGVGDNSDAFPEDNSESEDSDEDGVGDNTDQFPYDSDESLDSDDDGVGDNSDVFPNNSSEWADTDGDGHGDEEHDEFPYDNTQWSDEDGDGYGDNINGNNPDLFPGDPDEWADSDGDTFGDNYQDMCPYVSGTLSTGDFIGCPDSDGDGYADIEDEFDDEPTQWYDYDGDGYGDNPGGNYSDACPNQAGTSTLAVNYGNGPGGNGGGVGGSESGGGGEEFGPASYSSYGTNVTHYGCLDSDNDGYEDQTDMCPYSYGNSWVDVFACPDADQDGISDYDDPYPQNATTNIEDWDGDGYIDHSDDYQNINDQFPYDRTQWNDTDYDGYGDNLSGTNPDIFPLENSQWFDSDGDGYGDNEWGLDPDGCIFSSGNSTIDRYGCVDSDGDGYSNPDGDWSVYDGADTFISEPSQWDDYDEDGYGSNQNGITPDSCNNQFGESTMRADYIQATNEWSNVTEYGCPDEDGDGYEDISDPCPFSFGNSWADQLGCLDSDQDGISDVNDPYPQNATSNSMDWDGDGYLDHSQNPSDNIDDFDDDNTQWTDYDGDGFGDNPNGSLADLFPNEPSQWQDTDGDGYGDNLNGFEPDYCRFTIGNSTAPNFGCIDSDGDSWADSDDDFDSDSTQWSDYDGDGYGDEINGNNPDACVNQPGSSVLRAHYDGSTNLWSNVTEYGCPDEDGDGYEDNSDPCPFSFGNSWADQLGCLDSDQDGISDNNDPYQQTPTNDVRDWDGDGYLDHSTIPSENVDLFADDNTQWYDSDNDGMGDNPNGNMADLFPNEPSQWEDTDGDGYGDDPAGFEGDYCKYTAGNSTAPFFGCQDSDGDSWANTYDDFDLDATQWMDGDQDGYGDEMNGNNPDACPNQPGTSTMWANQDNTNMSHYGCQDKDNDGYDDLSDPCPNQYGTSWIDQLACPDQDQDGISDDNDPSISTPTADSEDWDGDGFIDHSDDMALNTDAFPNEPTQWQDTDGDGYGDNPNGIEYDMFINESSQWMDSDGDGYGDNALGIDADSCIYVEGNSTIDRLGCLDSDADGHSDSSSNWLAHPFGIADSHPYDNTQWEDLDSDGCGDNPDGINGDNFPTLSTQCEDTDGDGYGDNPLGVLADEFPEDPNEWADQDSDGYGDNTDQFPLEETQWIDSDNDGYGDNQNGRDGDEFPLDDTQWSDSDGDGYGDDRFIDGGDKFPDDPYQWNDTDGDGYGDEPVGINADAFPNNYTQWGDRDSDGYGDNSYEDGGDKFPDNPTQWLDSDEDGYGDNSDGIQGDAFPDDPQQWKDTDNDNCGDNVGPNIVGGDHFPRDPSQCEDTDNDGFGDNSAGNDPDAFPEESTQWEDSDGDGIGDNEFGNNPDICMKINETEMRLCNDDYDNDGWNNSDDYFPNEPTQWIDEDNDGKGDNCNGRNGDCSLNDRDNDGYTDPANPVYDEQGFIDSSSLSKGEDAFPGDPTEWSDYDQDNIGDNADQDDDGDGVSDTEEIREGTDSFNSADKPFAGVNVVGLTLGEWDLITILIGGPSALYLGFALMSRNRRTEKYEDMIYAATSEEELEDISNKYELSLQMRLIGPHHGLRLERIRSKQENLLEYQSVEEHAEEQQEETKQIPIIEEE